MVTVREIREKTMTPAKMEEAKNDLFGFYIGRPISYVISIPFIELGIKANTASLFSLIFTLIGFILMAFFSSTNIKLIGALFFILWNLFDGVDGNIARYTETTSKLGALWDDAVGYTALALMQFAMGISALNGAEQMFPILENESEYLYIVMGGISAISCILPRLIMHKKTIIFGNNAGKGINDKENYSFFKIVVFNFVSPSGFMQILMFLSVLFNLSSVFVIVYFCLELLICIYTYFHLLR